LSKNQQFDDEIKKIKAIQTEFTTYRVQAKKDLESIQNVLTSARTELADAGVEKHARIFNAEYKSHKASAKSWKNYSIGLIGLTVVVMIIFFIIMIWVFDDATSTKRLVESSVLAALVISMFSYALSLTVKNYFAEKHLESVNRHKANCLSSFNTFVDSADDERKHAVLLQATQTIFSHQKSGFLTKENEITTPNPVVEVVRNFSNSAAKIN
jgi:hypothetical protein